MTPIRQTLFVATHPKQRGNCQAACMAAILDISLDEMIDTAGDECFDHPEGWWGAIHEWLGRRNLKMVQIWKDHEEALKGLYSIGSGPSPRGSFWHAVVCKNGRMVFDPHPSDDGLAEILVHHVIRPMTDEERVSFKQNYG